MLSTAYDYQQHLHCYNYLCPGSWKRLPHTESTQSGINKISSHAGGSSSSLISLQPESFLGRRDTLPWHSSRSCDMLTAEHPPPYHILPRGSYLIIQQDSLLWSRSDIISLHSSHCLLFRATAHCWQTLLILTGAEWRTSYIQQNFD